LSLTSFFSPTGIVIIGASHEPTKLGHGLAYNLARSNYAGAMHFVNPKGGKLFGQPIYTNIAEVPDPVDLAVVLTPAPTVPQTLRECAKRGILSAIILSGGFREVGPEGAALEAEVLAVAQEYGMRFMGPNCVGILNTHLPVDVTFLPPPGPLPGEIAFISHSGALCSAVVDWGSGQGYGFSHMISLGNQANINEADVLAPVADDRFTRVLAMYLESISNGQRFVQEASQVTRSKPIIVLKSGRSASGQRAAASHTGALAGQEHAVDAAFRRCGVIRANTSEELFDWARALAWCQPLKGRAISILTNAGGPGVTASDAVEANGLSLAELASETVTALRQILPSAASVRNPVDILASGSPELYASSLKILLDDPATDGVLVIILAPPTFSAGAVAKAMVPIIQSAAKPVIVALMGQRMTGEAAEHLRSAHIPEYCFTERAISAMAILAQRHEFLARADEKPVTLEVDPGAVRSLLDSKSASPADILAAYGIPTLPIRLASSPAQAAEVARQLGFPVVLKVASLDISHKSDVGGVLLNLADEAAVSQGFETVVANARRAMPEANILGVHVQRMLPAGQEVIVGAVQDPLFGPLVMFGSGGVEVEGLKDVAFALAPLTRSDAERMLESTWAGRKLRGFRNLPPADRAAVLDVLLRLAQLAADFPELPEIEINPLRVLADGQGAFAIDVR